MKRWMVALTTMAALASAGTASADTFATGSLIIPMDTTYQDQGMLRAFGLVYKLLSSNVPVRWVIRSGKAVQAVDFTASATDLQSNAVITSHGYRGGPWVVDQADAAKALPIITAFQAANPSVKVHTATAPFSGDVSRLLVAAPTIGMHADKNQAIAIAYLTAAGIPDSIGDYTWADTSPDLLTPAEVAGPTTSNHHDGALFDAKGTPKYCQFMSMHWGVNEAAASPETVAEVREFLHNPVHFFAECQAVNAFENLSPYGFFLTKTGYEIGPKPASVDFLHADQPFAQLDGPFTTVGGSEPSYSIPAGGAYKNGEVVMLTEHGTPVGVHDLWMTGFLDGVCPPNVEICGSLGKVSYLGGHSYTTKLPMSANGTSQGTRLFLNSLFEAPCATLGGQPMVTLSKEAPTSTASPDVTFKLTYSNASPTVMLGTTLDDVIPAGSTFVSATDGGIFSGGAVHWNLGNLGIAGGTVSFTVKLSAFGDYKNTARLSYKVGVSPKSLDSNTTHTLYGVDTDKDGFIDSIDTCPTVPNPQQDLNFDAQNCGACGNVCAIPNANQECVLGVCGIGWCKSGYSDCDGQVANGCEVAVASFMTDPAHCGSCTAACSYPQATGVCTGGVCSMGACNDGFHDCNGLAADGCEYPDAALQSDPANCGTCGHACKSGFVCTAGSCVVDKCPAGYSDCNGNSSDGCEYANAGFQTDPAHCGSCASVCSTPHATPACLAGACAIQACAAGFSDCNGAVVDGCEYDDAGFLTDPMHCGGCATVCSFAHAMGGCSQGACVIGACEQGYSDCNKSAADGCEYDNAGLDSDPANCGACGVACALAHASSSCTGGKCVKLACDAGWLDLDADPANGCEYGCTKVGDTDSNCDGVDDDCNGVADNGYLAHACGVGACQSQSKCAAGVESCVPGDPSKEGPGTDPSCADLADNDCDGTTDLDDPDCLVVDDAGTPDAELDAADDVSTSDAPEQDALAEGGEPGDGSAVDVTAADAPQDVAAEAKADAAADAAGGSAQDAQPADVVAKDTATQDSPGQGGAAGAVADSGPAKDGAAAGQAGSSPEQPPASADEGGCGCRTAGESAGSSSVWWLLAGLATLVRTRRSRRAA